MDRMVAYYTHSLGMSVTERAGTRVTLALKQGLFSIDLLHAPDAPLRPYPCPGLYHFALVVPDRPALGAIFRRLIDRQEPFEGMADHLVSEALYIRDPEANGIELYRDRPMDEWVYNPDGSIHMVSDPIDSDGILASAQAPGTLHPGTRLGHIHLHVKDLDAASAFFEGELKLDRKATIPGALFFAAGDYHHHVGANTWAPDVPVPDGATGLLGYTWKVPDGDVAETATDPTGADVRFER
jgi:catechol 2,3-dioxygenase